MSLRWLILLVASASTLGCSAGGSCETETTACGCYARGARCEMVTESCWCPSECNSSINCVCGGGKFLRCETKK